MSVSETQAEESRVFSFSSIRIVGQQIVQMIRGLQYLYPATFSPENLHIIAHSFGSFAAGESA